MTTLFSFSLGIGTLNRNGEWMEAYFPLPTVDLDAPSSAASLASLRAASIDYREGNQSIALDDDALARLSEALDSQQQPHQAAIAAQLRGSARQAVVVVLARDEAPQSVAESYLKLQLLSHRLVQPHQINLDGIFTSLANIAWTNEGPIALEELPQRQLQARLEGRWLNVKCIDKFPVMSDYVVPSGVRIAHTARVRLGAHIGKGTTIMHEGFVNFNAGTAGASMIEGRVSAGVFVGEGSDLGGGSSTMGTLSGGGDVLISVGQNCLIGANAGIGISLGDRCTVEAGLYITAGSKVALLDEENQPIKQVKARSLSGQTDLLFRRNSQSGAIECKTNRSAVELNNTLHNNN